jgi:hypothetical protein
MTTEYRERELTSAKQSRDEARARFNNAKPYSKQWREAAADLEFWTSKVAYLEAPL